MSAGDSEVDVEHESEPATMTSFSASLGTETYRVSPGLASEGLKVMRFTVLSAFMAPRVFSLWLGRRFGGTAMVYVYFYVYVYVSKYICIHQLCMMEDVPGRDTTKDDTGAARGASGGGDDDTQDFTLPGGPTEAPDKRRSRWPGGARPKTKGPYEQLSQLSALFLALLPLPV